MPRLLPEQLMEWCAGDWEGVVPASISGVSMDSRTLMPDMLFFALPGGKVDGHEFVTDALRRGAAAAVVRRDFVAADDPRGCLLRVDDPARALRDAARGYRRWVDADVIGVTGSAGKTTVKEMTASVLRQRFRVAHTLGNWNNAIGLPLSILSMAESTQKAVIEIGTNHPGEIADLCAIARPNIGMITNIGAAHIEHFGSLEAIAREKGALLEALPAGGLGVLDRDDAMFETLRARCRARVLTLSSEDGDYVFTGRDAETNKVSIRETASGDVFQYRSQLPGLYAIKDAMFAIAVARSLGMNWVDIGEGLGQHRPQPMRWQVTRLRGADFINDAYNANPVSMKASIDALAELGGTARKWLVLGGMLELGRHEREEHLKLGAHIARYDWNRVVLIGRLGWVMAEGAAAAGFPEQKLCRCQSNEAVASLLLDEVRPGDVVLLKASRRQKLEQIQSAFETLT